MCNGRERERVLPKRARHFRGESREKEELLSARPPPPPPLVGRGRSDEEERAVELRRDEATVARGRGGVPGSMGKRH